MTTAALHVNLIPASSCFAAGQPYGFGSPWRRAPTCLQTRLKGLSTPHDATAYYRALGAALDRAHIVNLSLGGEDEDITETRLIEQAIRCGVVVVAAMGNDFDLCNNPHYPAVVKGVLAVGAVDAALQRADFSNTGDHIRLVGPGVDVWSTIPTHSSRIFKKETHYGTLDGTSMAAPFLSSTAALMLTAGGMPKKENALMDRLVARLCPGQTEWTEELGHGFLDVGASLANVPRKKKRTKPS